ncbi:MAG TPA: hypothetical protein VFU41_02455 [Gemmatimonadales bacterium]|nr:hypothetical protein [Gemmatimonadales bacterium]
MLALLAALNLQHPAGACPPPRAAAAAAHVEAAWRACRQEGVAAGVTFAWPTWEEPTWHERVKPAHFAMREVWGAW